MVLRHLFSAAVQSLMPGPQWLSVQFMMMHTHGAASHRHTHGVCLLCVCCVSAAELLCEYSYDYSISLNKSRSIKPTYLNALTLPYEAVHY